MASCPVDNFIQYFEQPCPGIFDSIFGSFVFAITEDSCNFFHINPDDYRHYLFIKDGKSISLMGKYYKLHKIKIVNK